MKEKLFCHFLKDMYVIDDTFLLLFSSSTITFCYQKPKNRRFGQNANRDDICYNQKLYSIRSSIIVYSLYILRQRSLWIHLKFNKQISLNGSILYSDHVCPFNQYDKCVSQYQEIFSLEMVQGPFCPYISHVQCHTSQTNKNVYIITHTLVIYHTHHMHGLSHYR